MRFSIYRFDPERDPSPRMQDFVLEFDPRGKMVLDALLLLKEQDETLTFRRSCREGVCGSDGMNINGKNGLACIVPIEELKEPVTLRPLPGMPVIRDLVVDMEPFFRQYESVKPWLQPADPDPEIERLQSPGERARLEGLYECILCGCCTSACPSWWWNPERFVGPAGLLQAARFLMDSRDGATRERLDDLEDPYRLFRCRNIMSCAAACPKGLDPVEAIHEIRMMLAERKL
jgi:succinate dehydrogenase / fumarate reductase iron-sulfur subunit